MDLWWEETNGDWNIEEHKDVGDHNDWSVLRGLKLYIIRNRSLCKEIDFEGHKVEILGLVFIVCFVQNVEQRLVVVLNSFWKINVIVPNDLIEGLQVPDEDLFLPFAGGVELEVIIVEEESGL